MAGVASPALSALPEASNLQADAADAREKKLPIVIFFRSMSCPYCRQVEENYLPWLLDENRRNPRFLIRTVEIDSTQPLTGFDGRQTDMRGFARSQGVRLVPHLRFVGPDGATLAPDLIGLNPPDFYGGYLDAAIQQAFERMRGSNPR